MATITLVRAKNAPGFPPYTTAEFRFAGTSMGFLTFPQANQWRNFAPNSKNFSSSGKLKLYMGNGILVDTSQTKIHPVAQTNNTRTLSCVYGPFTVMFSVTVT